MKVKKILLLVLVLIVVLSTTLTGCVTSNNGNNSNDKNNTQNENDSSANKNVNKNSDSNNDSKENSDNSSDEKEWELIDQHVFMNNNVTLPTDDNRMFERIREEFGINLIMESAVGNVAERAGIIIASGDYPDLTDSSIATFIDAGVLQPLDSYLKDQETYPELYRHFSNHFDALSWSDGKIYAMNNDNIFFNNEDNRSPLYFNPGFYIKWKVLEYFDYPEVPKTVPEFMQLIEDYVKENPTTEDGLPYTGFNAMADTTNWRWHPLRDAPMYVTGYVPEDGFKLDEKTGKFSFDRLSDTYHDYYKELNRMYNIGLMEPNFATNSFDDWKQVNQSGTVLGFYDMSWQTYWSVNDPITNAGGGNERFFPIALSMYEGDSNEYFRAPSIPGNTNGYAVFKSNENIEQVMNMFNGLASEEWQKYIHWGVEGEDYFVNEDGLFDCTDEQLANWGDDEWKQKNVLTGFDSGLIEWEGFYNDGNGFGPNNQPLVNNRRLGEDVQKGMEAYGIDSEHQLIPNAPKDSRFYDTSTYKITQKCTSLIQNDVNASVAKQAIEDHQALWLSKLVMAAPEDFEDMWEEYAKGYDDIDIDALLNIFNQFYSENK